MAGETEIERLLVRLVGDASDYQKMLRDAEIAAAKADQKVSRSFATMARNVASSLKSAGKSVQRFGQGVSRVGKSLLVGLTTPIIAFGAASVKLGTDFDASMQKIVGLVGVGQAQVDEWKKDILKLGPALGKSPQELSDGMFAVTSAGFRGKAAMDVLTASGKASAGGLGEVITVADAVTSAVTAYGEKVLGASQATDILTAAVREGKLEAASLAPVLGSVLPMASAMGIAFEDVAGTLAVMSRTGTNAAEGATAISAIMLTLQKPTDEARKMVEGAGLSFQQLRDIVREPGGIIEVMRTLKDTFGEDEEALSKVIPNVRALRAAMNILAQDGKTVDSVMAGVANSTGSTEKAWITAGKTAKGRFASAMSQVKSTLIEISKTVLPLVLTAVDKLQSFLKSGTEMWKSFSDTTKKVIVIVAGVAAAIGPLLIGLGITITTLGFALSAIGGVISAIGGAISVLLSPIGLVIAAIAGIGVAIAAIVMTLIGTDGLLAAWKFVSSTVVSFTKKAIGFFRNFQENAKIIIEWFRENWLSLFGSIGEVVVTFTKNAAKSFVIFFETGFRLGNFWQAKMITIFKQLFEIDMPSSIQAGLQMSGTAFIGFASGATGILAAIFDGDDSDRETAKETLQTFLDDLGGDAEKAADGEGWLEGTRRIMLEQYEKLPSALEGADFKVELPELLFGDPEETTALKGKFDLDMFLGNAGQAIKDWFASATSVQAPELNIPIRFTTVEATDVGSFRDLAKLAEADLNAANLEAEVKVSKDPAIKEAAGEEKKQTTFLEKISEKMSTQLDFWVEAFHGDSEGDDL